MKSMVLMLMCALSIVAFTQTANAHCEVPCGIYDDALRIQLLKEHTTTIEKAMAQIRDLSQAGHDNPNQLIRWVSNKESHATELQHIVTQYFMTQRIKLPTDGDKAAQEKYNQQLASLHAMLVYAMKAKQTTEQQWIEKLRAEIERFEALYG